MPSNGGTLQSNFTIIGFTVLIFLLLAQLGLHHTTGNWLSEPLWTDAPLATPTPLVGVTLFMLMHFGRAVLPGILIGSTLAHFSIGFEAFAAFSVSIGNTLEAGLASLMLRRWNLDFQNGLFGIRAIGLYASALALPCLVAAIWSSFSLYLFFELNTASLRRMIETSFFADFVSMLVFYSALSSLVGNKEISTKWRFFVTSNLFLTCLPLVTWIAFQTHFTGNPTTVWIYQATVFAGSMWAAVHFGFVGTTTFHMSLAVAALIIAQIGFGPMQPLSQFPHVAALQPLLLTSTSIGFVIAAQSTAKKKALLHAREGIRQRTLFIENISHEIKTPLHGITGTTELLLKEDLNATSYELVQSLHLSGKALYGIMSDLIDFSKIKFDVLEIKKEPFDVYALIENLQHFFKPEAIGKNILFETLTSPQVPQFLVGDSAKIFQILSHLLSNSFKFCNHGRIMLEVYLKKPIQEGLNFSLMKPLGPENSPNQAEIIFAVHDTGCGIETEKLDLIFKEFMISDSSKAPSQRNLGIGLTMSKSLADALKGEILVESTLNKGTTFRFLISLPLAEAAPAATSVSKFHGDQTHAFLKIEDDSEATSMNSFTPKILIVDDSSVNRLVLKAQLNTLGYDATLAKDGLEALELTRQTQFDLIFMDCRMPRLDGKQAASAIRKDEREITSRRPSYIVAVTTFTSDSDKCTCIEAGMNDFLTKPFTLNQTNNQLTQAKKFLMDCTGSC